ncbi:hypothetical protein O181_001721 [Austropuccinia psidii MF-1]|uniref:Uncharacterized protein n=1 Tax=Austropuccinia psidii MF-1 TaxID=1389203 RepID=A0A9Q3BBK3_9BASI|nr:hypothetical protein [Austropuccinia psidii MF-1]
MAIDPREPCLVLKSQGTFPLKTSTMASRSHLHKGASPQDHRNPQLQLKLDSLCENQGWYIYGIIYHCVPFFLSNQMVMVSGTNYVIPTPVLKSITHFKWILLSHSVSNPWRLPQDHSRTPTTCPCRSWVVLCLRILPRAIPRGYQPFNQSSRHQVLQYSLDNSIGPYRLYFKKAVWRWPFWANSHSAVGIPLHSSILKMARSVLTQNSQYSRRSTLPDQSFSSSPILGTFSSLGNFSPVN